MECRIDACLPRGIDLSFDIPIHLSATVLCFVGYLVFSNGGGFHLMFEENWACCRRVSRLCRILAPLIVSSYCHLKVGR
jgi:hypothetical protein